MLCQTLEPSQSIDAYSGDAWVLEQKFDGHRVVVCVGEGAVAGWSRPGPGTDVPNSRSLAPQIAEVVLRMPPGVYDGELWLPGGHSWDLARKDLRHARTIQIFDVMELQGQSVMALPYDQRRELLTMAVAKAGGQTAVVVSEAVPVSRAAVDAIWARGGEGAILKERSSTYRPGKRSWSWLKVKQVLHAVLTIVGYKEGKSGPYSSVVLRDADGNETTVASKGKSAIRADPQAWIGRRLAIEYQMRTDSGNYRHPRWDHIVEGA
jgi:bifunctional non-homologous end joining protein LigD